MLQLDVAVLQFQNQKLTQKLETQKSEYMALENKFFQLKDGQRSNESMLMVVKKSWEKVAFTPFLLLLLSICLLVQIYNFIT